MNTEGIKLSRALPLVPCSHSHNLTLQGILKRSLPRSFLWVSPVQSPAHFHNVPSKHQRTAGLMSDPHPCCDEMECASRSSNQSQYSPQEQSVMWLSGSSSDPKGLMNTHDGIVEDKCRDFPIALQEDSIALNPVTKVFSNGASWTYIVELTKGKRRPSRRPSKLQKAGIVRRLEEKSSYQFPGPSSQRWSGSMSWT